MSLVVVARRLAIGLSALVLFAVGRPGVASAAAAPPVGKLESVQVTAFSNTAA